MANSSGPLLGYCDDHDGRGQKLPGHDDLPCHAWLVRGKNEHEMDDRLELMLDKAGFFPGAVFLVSSWYPRYELQQRLAIFYTASAFSGALSGLLAFAIARMVGLRGVEGWRWIFLIEGAITVTAGLAMPFLIPDAPELASWLDADEKKFIDLRLRRSGVRTATQEGDKFSWKLLGKTMIDWKIFLGILMAWANSVPNAAFKFTMPQIIEQLGFSTTQSQLLTIPPYFCGGVSAWIVGKYADRFKWRMPFIVGPLIIVATALGILVGLSDKIADNVGPMYFAIMLAQIGIYPLLPGVTTWTSNNLGTSWKRSIGLAWLLAAGNLGSKLTSKIMVEERVLTSIQASLVPTSSLTRRRPRIQQGTVCRSESYASVSSVL